LSDYRSIACADHERLEFAALTRQWLDLNVTAGEPPGRQRLLPVDLYTRDGAEWLQARNEVGETVTIRLDQLAF
jgi:Rho-binding antiterminator